MAVHAGETAVDDVVGKSIGRHRDDRNHARVATLHGTDRPGRVEAVHARHHDVHVDRAEVARSGVLEDLHRLLTVHRRRHLHAVVFEHEGRDLAVQLVVLDHQRADARHRNLVEVLPLRMKHTLLADGKRELDHELRADAEGALDLHPAAHTLDQLLRDREAEASPLVLRPARLCVLRKRHTDALEHLLAHATALVLTVEAEHRLLWCSFRGQCLCRSARHFPCRSCCGSARVDRRSDDSGGGSIVRGRGGARHFLAPDAHGGARLAELEGVVRDVRQDTA